jgi:hypothetical protein
MIGWIQLRPKLAEISLKEPLKIYSSHGPRGAGSASLMTADVLQHRHTLRLAAPHGGDRLDRMRQHEDAVN